MVIDSKLTLRRRGGQPVDHIFLTSMEYIEYVLPDTCQPIF